MTVHFNCGICRKVAPRKGSTVQHYLGTRVQICRLCGAARAKSLLRATRAERSSNKTEKATA